MPIRGGGWLVGYPTQLEPGDGGVSFLNSPSWLVHLNGAPFSPEPSPQKGALFLLVLSSIGMC